MKLKKAGILIIVIGLCITLYTGLDYISRDKIIDIGGLEVTTEKNKSVKWESFIGAGIMVVGGLVYLTGKMK